MVSIFKSSQQRRSLSKNFIIKRIWNLRETKLWTLNFFLGTCALYASRVVLPICATAMAQEYSWSKTDSGTIMSCFFWGYAFTQIIAGNLADRIGGEQILPFTSIFWSSLTFFTPQLFDLAYRSKNPFLILILVRVFIGVGQGFCLPSMASIISKHLIGNDKGRVFGICLAGSHFGSVVAGSLGAILLNWFGWRSLFQFVGLIGLLWCFFFIILTRRKINLCNLFNISYMFFLKYRRKIISKNVKKHSENLLLSSENKNTNSLSLPLHTLFKHSSFWAAAVAQYCGANAYFTMFSWLPSYFSDNYPEKNAVLYNVIPHLAIVVTSIISPFIASRLISSGKSLTLTRRLMEATSLLGMAMCFLIVIITTKFNSCLFVFTLAMAFRGFHHGGVAVNPHDFAPNHTGAVFGIFNAFSAITGFIGVYLAGYILHIFNNRWSYVLLLTAIQCVIGGIVYSLWGTGSKII